MVHLKDYKVTSKKTLKYLFLILWVCNIILSIRWILRIMYKERDINNHIANIKFFSSKTLYQFLKD